MKKIELFVLLVGIVLVVTACSKGNEEGQTKTSSVTIETVEMRPVEEKIPQNSNEIQESSNRLKETSPTTQVKETKTNNKKLLEEYGNAYANFSSINDRNEKLKKVMTKECIKENGIDVKTGAKLESTGKIVSIYQNDKQEYAVLLDCEQNGTQAKVLLLAKVQGNKISEMTYNSVKKEY
ncbi:EF0163 family protein [Enterococcus faecalis]|uniref:EF0163 family protein n=1 Tax=Enterococcus faecalis TaxID=1351 RepID=UPI0025B06C61|nr:EF0163 family protein [Enterococcus faecalis]MDN3183534.1 hypothetical protein [Enterococcus faecalis]